MLFLESVNSNAKEIFKYAFAIIIITFFVGLHRCISLNNIDLMNFISSYYPFDFALVEPSVKLISLISPYIILFIIFYFYYLFFHNKNIKYIINGSSKIKWNKILVGSLVWLIISVSLNIVMYIINPREYFLNFNSKFLFLYILVVLFLMPTFVFVKHIIIRSYLIRFVSFFVRRKITILIAFPLLYSFIFSIWYVSTIDILLVVFVKAFICNIFFTLLILLSDGLEFVFAAFIIHDFTQYVLFCRCESTMFPVLIKVNCISKYYEMMFCFLSCFIYVIILTYIYNWDYAILFSKIRRKN